MIQYIVLSSIWCFGEIPQGKHHQKNMQVKARFDFNSSQAHSCALCAGKFCRFDTSGCSWTAMAMLYFVKTCKEIHWISEVGIKHEISHLAFWVRPATLRFLDVFDVFPGNKSNQTKQNEIQVTPQMGSTRASQLPWNHTWFPAQRVAFPRRYHLVSRGSSSSRIQVARESIYNFKVKCPQLRMPRYCWYGPS